MESQGSQRAAQGTACTDLFLERQCWASGPPGLYRDCLASTSLSHFLPSNRHSQASLPCPKLTDFPYSKENTAALSEY